MKNQRRHQTGFTLIELIAVIVILGILTAVALPRFMGMTAEARMAKMRAAVGAVNSAASIYHARWLANPGAVEAGDEVEGYVLTQAPVNGYPDAADIASLAGLAAADYTPTVAAAQVTIADVARANCSFIYSEAAANNVPGINQGGITDGNCQ